MITMVDTQVMPILKIFISGESWCLKFYAKLPILKVRDCYFQIQKRSAELKKKKLNSVFEFLIL